MCRYGEAKYNRFLDLAGTGARFAGRMGGGGGVMDLHVQVSSMAGEGFPGWETLLLT